MLVLRTYVYLCDANSKGSYHETMTENLWDRVAQLTLQSGTPAPSGGIFLVLPQAFARKASSEALALYQAAGGEPSGMLPAEVGRIYQTHQVGEQSSACVLYC
jgi:hypothetical protein